MKTLKDQIIDKQDELIQTQKDWMILRNIPCEIRDVNWVRDIQNRRLEICKLESELATLKSQLSEPETYCDSCGHQNEEICNTCTLFGKVKQLDPLLKESGDQSVNFMQSRELTDEEWLKLPKEEILQLYKNCYSMLQNFLKQPELKESVGKLNKTVEEIRNRYQFETNTFYVSGSQDYIYWLENKLIQSSQFQEQPLPNDYVKTTSTCSNFQEQPITDEMIEVKLNSINLNSTEWKVCYGAIKWALSLKAQIIECKDCGKNILLDDSVFHWDTGARRCKDCSEKYIKMKAQKAQLGDERPKIICTIGSSRFAELEAVKKWEFEKEGYICIGMHLLPQWYADKMNWKESHHGAEQENVADIMDNLHLKKIEMADKIFVINYQGYIGERTRFEIDYAKKIGKPIEYLEKPCETD